MFFPIWVSNNLEIEITFIPKGGFPGTTSCGRHSFKWSLLPCLLDLRFFSLRANCFIAWMGGWVDAWMCGSMDGRGVFNVIVFICMTYALPIPSFNRKPLIFVVVDLVSWNICRILVSFMMLPERLKLCLFLEMQKLALRLRTYSKGNNINWNRLVTRTEPRASGRRRARGCG